MSITVYNYRGYIIVVSGDDAKVFAATYGTKRLHTDDPITLPFWYEGSNIADAKNWVDHAVGRV